VAYLEMAQEAGIPKAEAEDTALNTCELLDQQGKPMLRRILLDFDASGVLVEGALYVSVMINGYCPQHRQILLELVGAD
jgi:hypothetical protein